MIRRIHNSDLKANARQLRKNQTKQERKLWYEFLKNLDCHFVRQKVVGNYIVDFYCARHKLIIELDGSQHYDEVGEGKDKIRDAYLESCGFTVLRYTNLEINTNFEGVCKDIANKCGMDIYPPHHRVPRSLPLKKGYAFVFAHPSLTPLQGGRWRRR